MPPYICFCREIKLRYLYSLIIYFLDLRVKGDMIREVDNFSSNLQPGVASALKHSVRLRREASVSKRGPFKKAYWVSFKRARDCG